MVLVKQRLGAGSSLKAADHGNRVRHCLKTGQCSLNMYVTCILAFAFVRHCRASSPLKTQPDIFFRWAHEYQHLSDLLFSWPWILGSYPGTVAPPAGHCWTRRHCHWCSREAAITLPCLLGITHLGALELVRQESNVMFLLKEPTPVFSFLVCTIRRAGPSNGHIAMESWGQHKKPST